jgi:hypothetical protein
MSSLSSICASRTCMVFGRSSKKFVVTKTHQTKPIKQVGLVLDFKEPAIGTDAKAKD